MKTVWMILLVVSATVLITTCSNDCDTFIEQVCAEKGPTSAECSEIKTILASKYQVDLNCDEKSDSKPQFSRCRRNQFLFNTIIKNKDEYCGQALELLESYPN